MASGYWFDAREHWLASATYAALSPVPDLLLACSVLAAWSTELDCGLLRVWQELDLAIERGTWRRLAVPSPADTKPAGLHRQ